LLTSYADEFTAYVSEEILFGRYLSDRYAISLFLENIDPVFESQVMRVRTKVDNYDKNLPLPPRFSLDQMVMQLVPPNGTA
jgi:hypothetical protein